MEPLVYILLPVHNRKKITERFIHCLLAQNYKNYRLVLIDDGSTDGTDEMVKSLLTPFVILRGDGNLWWAGALQKGFYWLKTQSISSTDIVLIINDDTVFNSEFLQKALQVINHRSHTILMAQCYSLANNKLIDSGVHIDWQHLTFNQAKTIDEINCLSTRGLFLKVGDFINLKGFHPHLLPHYLSDYEFTYRAFNNGLKLIVAKEVQLHVDQKCTGYRQIETYDSYWDFLRKYFSKKSAINPIYWITFICLACPWRWKFLNFCRVFKRMASTIVKQFINT